MDQRVSIACRASINEDVELLHHVGVGEVRRLVGGDQVAIDKNSISAFGISLVVDADVVEVLRAQAEAQMRLTAGRVDDAAVDMTIDPAEFGVSRPCIAAGRLDAAGRLPAQRWARTPARAPS